MKVIKDTSIWDIHDYTYMKNVIITLKNGKKKKYFILDTDSLADDPPNGKENIVYMTHLTIKIHLVKIVMLEIAFQLMKFLKFK